MILMLRCTPLRLGMAPVLLWALLLLMPGGCSQQDKRPIHLDSGVKRPEVALILISVDGFAADKFDQFLAAGDLPNISARLVDGGVRVRRATASQPTITYANLATILTGRWPGRHGILGNKWFDRYALVYRDYTTVATYRWVGDDYMAPTIFERVVPGHSASIQCANRRGATRIIDNWASSGLRWFVGKYEAVDRLVPRRMEIVAREANRWGAWPVLIHAYMPALDEVGHRCGPESPRYRTAAMNVDRQIGLLFAAVEEAGMLERTCFVLVSDHGHVPTESSRFFDVGAHLRRAGLKVQGEPPSPSDYRTRRRHYRDVDAVIVAGGDRRVAIHLPGPAGWHERPDFETVETFVDPTIGGATSLWTNGTVKMALAPRRWSDGRRSVEVYTHQGHSRLARRYVGGEARYIYQVVTTDALDGVIPAGEHDAERWLALTADTELPDFVVSMYELFEAPRAGDIMVVANLGWDFSRGQCGGHGGVDAADVLVPMAFAGPGLPAGASIDHARLVDVAPTILGLLGRSGHNGSGSFDGVDRSNTLRGAGRYSGQHADRAAGR